MPDTPSDEQLGLNDAITRRDFLNATLIGAGAALLAAKSPLEAAQSSVQQHQDQWTGPSGVGDYARANGNTKPVLDAAHRMRDNAFARMRPMATGEVYDLVVVGGGITGLTTAYYFAKGSGGTKRCLVLENHPIFGGEARQNEVDVHGERLIAPQGSNDFGVPRAGSGWQSDLWDELRMPREFTWSEPGADAAGIRLARDNYQPMDGVGEYGVDVGYFFDQHSSLAPSSQPRWLKNIWQNDLAELPVSDEVRKDLLKWRSTAPVTDGRTPEQFARYLDTMTYRDYLEKVAGYRPEVTKVIEPIVGLISGASPDAVSANATRQIGMPGVSRPRGRNAGLGLSFPGGNVTYARHLVKALNADAISGEFSFDGLMTGRVNWRALDDAAKATRIRVGCTVSRVAHVGTPERAEYVDVTYAKEGKLYTVRARRVAMATGGWVNKHVIAELPATMTAAYQQFVYAPALIVNVALTNWKFMHKLGVGAARWFDDEGVGFIANLRQPMTTAGYTPPVDPAKPNVLTYYMGLYTPGRNAAEQGTLGRTRLLGTSYAQYERAIRTQLTHQFSSVGFDAKRDVAGIILNRWGHARLVQPPGWFFGVDGQPAAREVVARGFGRIHIGHSELNGHQSATGAIAQGKRLAEEAAGGVPTSQG